MIVKAKFKCTSKTPIGPPTDDTVNVTLSFCAVYEDKGLNKEWCKWTPNGYLLMTVTNPAAVDAFTTGKDYILTFEEVE